jgi:Ser/Thr protein kinase RdoA (MazF antagonist)
MSSISPAQAAEIARRHYGLAAAAERLASEHDDTFRLSGADGVARLLKISVAPADGDGAGFQTALLLHLARVAPELPAQRVIAALDGRPEITLTLDRSGEGSGASGAGGGERRVAG